jgi:hypothetical protein
MALVRSVPRGRRVEVEWPDDWRTEAWRGDSGNCPSSGKRTSPPRRARRDKSRPFSWPEPHPAAARSNCAPTARRAAAPRRSCCRISVEQMVELVRVGLATATPQRVKAGRDRMEVATLRITEAGRKAIGAKHARRAKGTCKRGRISRRFGHRDGDSRADRVIRRECCVLKAHPAAGRRPPSSWPRSCGPR